MKTLVDGHRGRPLKYLNDLKGEMAELFGAPPPILPRGDADKAGQKRIFIDFLPNLGILLREFLEHVYGAALKSDRQHLGEAGSVRQLRELLLQTMIETVCQERRNGLYNLLFLSLGKVFGETISEFCSQRGRKPYYKYRLHPFISPFLSNLHSEVLTRAGALVHGSAASHLGSQFNNALIVTILTDQLPLVTTESEMVTVDEVLGGANPRFPISLTGFRNIQRIVAARLRSAIDRREHRWLEDLRQGGDLPFAVAHDTVPHVVKHLKTLHYMFLDYEGLGRQIIKSKGIGAKPAAYPQVCRQYLDLLTSLKRNECVQLLKGRVQQLSDVQALRSEELFSTGSLYRFKGKGRIVNESRKITTLFLDIRGFTRKSEAAISAGDLTGELYTIFDPIVPIVKALDGRIDKFTGDGMMVTFGVQSRQREDPLHALRTAVRIQETLRSLRKQGATDFEMGISIHTGIAFVANFFADEHRVDQTVIGRNINIAGRLSSAGDTDLVRAEENEFEDLVETLKLSLDSDEERDRFVDSLPRKRRAGKTIGGVAVDGGGGLYNHGILLTRETIQEIDRLVDLRSGEDREEG
ncbi:MAG: adenylate/guanylate cyclase domain-containing protein, partial [bacterium]|nr:adenylate/guanylate cyclase domain-containing protein [bacterium]